MKNKIYPFIYLVALISFLAFSVFSQTVPTTSTKNTANPIKSAELSGLDAEVLVEVNKMRTNPLEYAKIFEEYLKTNKGNSFFVNGVEFETEEGKVPVEELIKILKETQPLPEFIALDGLTKAATDHAKDLVKSNKSGHLGSDGTLPDERIRRYGFAPITNENISYYTKTAREVVMTMLIDDGNSHRNHRKNLLSSKLKFVGIANGENKAVENFCVIVFAESFSENKKGIKQF